MMKYCQLTFDLIKSAEQSALKCDCDSPHRSPNMNEQ